MFRFRNLGKCQADPALADRSVEPRLAQVFVPLLSVIDDPAARNSLRELMRQYHRELVTGTWTWRPRFWRLSGSSNNLLTNRASPSRKSPLDSRKSMVKITSGKLPRTGLDKSFGGSLGSKLKSATEATFSGLRRDPNSRGCLKDAGSAMPRGTWRTLGT